MRPPGIQGKHHDRRQSLMSPKQPNRELAHISPPLTLGLSPGYPTNLSGPSLGVLAGAAIWNIEMSCTCEMRAARRSQNPAPFIHPALAGCPAKPTTVFPGSWAGPSGMSRGGVAGQVMPSYVLLPCPPPPPPDNHSFPRRQTWLSGTVVL